MSEGVRGMNPAVPAGENEQIAYDGPMGKKEKIPGKKRAKSRDAGNRSRNRRQNEDFLR